MGDETRCVRYSVKNNETLSDIMRRFDVSIRDIKEQNACDLFSLREGQTLMIKYKARLKGRCYELKEGETFRTVAEKFGVSVPALLKANSNFMPNEIRQGICIALPDHS